MNIDELNNKINEYIIKYKEFLTKNIYITSKMYDNFIKKHAYLYEELSKNENYSKQNQKYKYMESIINEKEKILEKHNNAYIKLCLDKYQEYFDNMFINIDKNIKLDKEQREAIICEEPNLLILSGAGSGKTTTITAKVKYLIDIKKINPHSIAVITFTKKAKEELEIRLNEKLNLNVDVYTFHNLGLKIIREYNENISTIVEEKGQYQIISDYIKNTLFKEKEKFKLFFEAFKNKTKLTEEYILFDSYQDYHNYMYKRKYITDNKTMEQYLKEQANKRRSYKKTLNGEVCRSKEEVDIANFLYINGINYEYERRYINKNKQASYPDFYIEQNNNYNYIEHFGIDKNLKINNSFTETELKKYLKTMELKEKWHKEEKIEKLFIITYSQIKGKNNYLDSLYKQLKNKGYVLTKRTNEEIYERLKQTSEDRYISNFIYKIVIPFISYFKRTNHTIEYLEQCKENNNSILNKQIEVMKDLYLHYEKTLKEKNLIDFEDMINLAYKIMPKVKEKNLGVDYKYLIIDEYQDVSIQRFNLTKKISELFSANIIAVGDDYQSIFGFSGSRIDLTTDFQYYLEDAKSIPIKNVYRNSQELIDIANKFITKNQKQLKKELISTKRLPNPIEIFIYDDSNFLETNKNKTIIIDMIIDKIYQNSPKSKILLLERYKNDIDNLLYDDLFRIKNKETIINKKHPNIKIDYLTIHKSKGLEYDNCILINAIDDKYGFPSKIEDEKIIKILKPILDEEIEYPEERRLFYVAITRTKNKLYIVCPKSKASKFVKEIAMYENVLIHK